MQSANRDLLKWKSTFASILSNFLMRGNGFFFGGRGLIKNLLRELDMCRICKKYFFYFSLQQ